jgi:hypothetical protein
MKTSAPPATTITVYGRVGDIEHDTFRSFTQAQMLRFAGLIGDDTPQPYRPQHGRPPSMKFED